MVHRLPRGQLEEALLAFNEAHDMQLERIDALSSENQSLKEHVRVLQLVIDRQRQSLESQSPHGVWEGHRPRQASPHG
eukprot:4499186-Amphidinium_carterae.1